MWARQEGFLPATSLPLTDRGFRYGMAVFETCRVQGGQVHFLAEHLERLGAACRDSAFPLEEEVFTAFAEFARQQVWPRSCGVLRLQVTAGDGPLGDPARRCRALMSFEARQPLAPADCARGFALQVAEAPYTPLFGGRKTHNYWPNAEALRLARLAGCNEALLFDSQGRLVSCCAGNVFLSFKGAEQDWVTPPLAVGARRGVVREKLMEAWHARERGVRREDLERVASAFVLNSWLGAMPVSRIETLSLKTVPIRQCLPGISWPSET
jgi:branched-subunit amino acid aminotransferase/4-amino-4-deoxychorismate lyase